MTTTSGWASSSDDSWCSDLYDEDFLDEASDVPVVVGVHMGDSDSDSDGDRRLRSLDDTILLANLDMCVHSYS
jgi:hypothetical protein